MQHNMMFLKYYLKRQWPGEKALKPKNNLKLVFLSSDIKDNLKKICSIDTLCVVYFSAAEYEWHWESHSAETEKVVDLLLKIHFFFFMQTNDSEDSLILTWWSSPGGNHSTLSHLATFLDASYVQKRLFLSSCLLLHLVIFLKFCLVP